MRQLAALFAALLVQAPAPAQVRFTVTELGTLGGLTSQANALNHQGQVVGQSARALGAGAHAFSFEGGLMRDLDPLTAGAFPSSEARAVNGLGQVVGAQGNQAALFVNRSVTLLGNLGGDVAVATGINDAGLIVGKATLANGLLRAFQTRDGGVLQELLFSGDASSAEAVDTSGRIAGWMRSGTATLPVLWQNALFPLVLEFPIGAGYAGRPKALNDLGTVVGERESALGAPGGHAAVWRLGRPVELIPGDDAPPGMLATSVARGINDWGQVVGYAERRLAGAPDPLSNHGFLWAGGQRIKLEDRLEGSPGVRVADATGINRWGQVSAVGGDGRALLLTPTGTLVWKGNDGDRFGDTAAWDSDGLGFGPSPFLSARIDATGTTRVLVGGEQRLDALTLGAASAAGDAVLQLNAGATLAVTQLDVGAGGVLTGHGHLVGEIRHRGRIEVLDGERLALHGPLLHEGTIAVADGGELHLLGDVQAAADFRTAGNGQLLFDARVAVEPGAGRLVLGNSRFSGDLTLRLGGRHPGSGHDQLSFEGRVAFDPGSTLTLRWADGFVAAAGDRFQLFEFSSLPDGRPDSLDLPDLPDGLVWRSGMLLVTGELGVVAVPEPASVALWLAGLALLARQRFRGRPA